MQGVSRRVGMLFDMIIVYFDRKDTPFQRNAQLFHLFFLLLTEQHRFSDRRTEEHKRGSGQAFPYRWITFFTSTSTKSWLFACKVAYFTGFLRKFLFVSSSTYPLLNLYLFSTYSLLTLYLPSTYPLPSFYLSSIQFLQK